MTENLFFELVQIALNQRQVLSHAPSAEEWESLYAQAKRQAVLGICFLSVNKLKEQNPPRALFLRWIGASETIRKRNVQANKRSAEVTKMFAEAGFRSCILKGQGNALMYDNPYSRTSGDIDIWVEGERGAITAYVKGRTPGVFEQYHHIDFPIFKGMPVEVHYTPARLLSNKYNDRFQAYCREQMAVQMANMVDVPDGAGQFCVPTACFNAVFQLAHIMSHFFIEGIGLRHFIDYYHVLRNDEVRGRKEELRALFQNLGMLRFAKGVMWIERECLNLSEDCMIVEPDEKAGRLILNEMLEGGNFGHHDERYAGRARGYLARGITDVYRLLKLSTVFPSESFWKIYRKIENQKWKIKG